MLDFIKPEALVGVGGLAIVLMIITLTIIKGWWVPLSTHKRELAAAQAEAAQARLDREALRAELNERMDKFRDDHKVRMDEAREDFSKALELLRANIEREMAGARADWAAVLVAKQRDADDWRGAYHISAENAKTSEDRMDEVLQYVRLSHDILRALQNVSSASVQPPHPRAELPSGGPADD